MVELPSFVMSKVIVLVCGANFIQDSGGRGGKKDVAG